MKKKTRCVSTVRLCAISSDKQTDHAWIKTQLQLVLARKKYQTDFQCIPQRLTAFPHSVAQKSFDEWAPVYSFDDDAIEMPFLWHFFFTYFPLANGGNLAPNPIKSCFRLYFNNICTCEYWLSIGKKHRLNNNHFLWNEIPISMWMPFLMQLSMRFPLSLSLLLTLCLSFFFSFV